jgi:hypothetical protein
MPRATHFNKTISTLTTAGYFILLKQEDGISSLESRLSSLELRTDSVMVATSVAMSASRLESKTAKDGQSIVSFE